VVVRGAGSDGSPYRGRARRPPGLSRARPRGRSPGPPRRPRAAPRGARLPDPHELDAREPELLRLGLVRRERRHPRRDQRRADSDRCAPEPRGLGRAGDPGDRRDRDDAGRPLSPRPRRRDHALRGRARQALPDLGARAPPGPEPGPRERRLRRLHEPGRLRLARQVRDVEPALEDRRDRARADRELEVCGAPGRDGTRGRGGRLARAGLAGRARRRRLPGAHARREPRRRDPPPPRQLDGAAPGRVDPLLRLCGAGVARGRGVGAARRRRARGLRPRRGRPRDRAPVDEGSGPARSLPPLRALAGERLRPADLRREHRPARVRAPRDGCRPDRRLRRPPLRLVHRRRTRARDDPPDAGPGRLALLRDALELVLRGRPRERPALPRTRLPARQGRVEGRRRDRRPALRRALAPPPRVGPAAAVLGPVVVRDRRGGGGRAERLRRLARRHRLPEARGGLGPVRRHLGLLHRGAAHARGRDRHEPRSGALRAARTTPTPTAPATPRRSAVGVPVAAQAAARRGSIQT
jgi:hypothetical protein